MLVETGERQGPLHRRISSGLRELIDLGELPPLAVLPSERALAAALTVSRTTAVTAYQTLRNEGRLSRRRGSGTQVRAPAQDDREIVTAPSLAGDHAAAQYLNGSLATIDLATAALPMAPVVADAASALGPDDYLRLGAQYHGYHPRGLPALRSRIAAWYTECGLPTDAEQILVTSGAQQALELAVAGCLQPGDPVIVEEPTYRGALDAFTHAGCRIRTVPRGRDGIDLAQLRSLCSARQPRLLYLQSTVHNPTGSVLTDEQRERLNGHAGSCGAVVLDDTTLAETALDGAELRPLAAHGDRDNIITVGSMSKLFWGGLRVGWLRGQQRAISRLAQLKGSTDLGTSLISQQVSVTLIDHVDRAREHRQQTLPHGLSDLTALLLAQLPDWTWQRPAGGASLWVRIPVGDATGFANVALRHGVAVLAGTVFSPTAAAHDHIRLPFALPRSVLTAGVNRLEQAWRTYLHTTSTATPSDQVTT